LPTLVAELMKRIPQVPTKIPHKHDRLVDRVARHNPKVHAGKYDRVELAEWVKEIERIFIVVEVPEEKKVNILGCIICRVKLIFDGTLLR